MTSSLTRSGRRCLPPAMLGLLAAVALWPGELAGASSPDLLAATPGPARVGPSADPTVVRSRAVSVDFEQLSALQPGRGLVFNVFENVSFPATVETAGTSGTFSGGIDGKPHGTFVLVVNEGSLTAILRVPGEGTYRIRSSGAGGHVVQEIDDASFPSCASDGEHAVLNGGIAGDAAADDGSVIDVLVVYTPLARGAMGGTAAIEAEISLAAAYANSAYNASFINTQLNVVHTAEVNYNESSGYADHLYRLTNPSDGFMDNVHDLRDQYAADMVSLIVDDGQYCGIAWVMNTVSPAFASSAFSVTTWYCAAANLTFAHELGHNMGCLHDRANSGSGGAFPYSYGYQHPWEIFRTVMAYDCPGGCPRLTAFSNPDVLYQGHPTGVPTSEPDSAHNTLTINQTAFTIANFRNSIPPDCNGNGVPDAEDIAGGTSQDCNGNGVPDSCDFDDATSQDCNGNGTPDECDVAADPGLDINGNDVPDDCECLGDLNGDGEVAVQDFLFLLADWGPCTVCEHDLDDDGIIGITDFLSLLARWGPCP
ncbi:MAG: M12 family metallo-peptidase [Planctomycetota bacterium]